MLGAPLSSPLQHSRELAGIEIERRAFEQEAIREVEDLGKRLLDREPIRSRGQA
jgi:hypothetical protein